MSELVVVIPISEFIDIDSQMWDWVITKNLVERNIDFRPGTGYKMTVKADAVVIELDTDVR